MGSSSPFGIGGCAALSQSFRGEGPTIAKPAGPSEERERRPVTGPHGLLDGGAKKWRVAELLGLIPFPSFSTIIIFENRLFPLGF